MRFTVKPLEEIVTFYLIRINCFAFRGTVTFIRACYNNQSYFIATCCAVFKYYTILYLKQPAIWPLFVPKTASVSWGCYFISPELIYYAVVFLASK